MPEAVRLIDETPPAGRAALIDVLAAKGARDRVDLVFAQARSPEPAVRAAAVAALAALAGENDLGRLLDLLSAAADSEETVALQNAVAAAAGRQSDPERRADALVAFLAGAPAPRRAVILKVLPRVAGPSSLRAAEAALADKDPQVQAAAVYALSQWPDLAAAEDLVRIVSTSANRKYVLMALEGYVRIVNKSDSPTFKKLALLKGALALPKDEADRKLGVRGIAEIRDPGAFRLLGDSLGSKELRATAAQALLEMAADEAPEERWLSGHEAVSILRRVEAGAGDSAERDLASRTIADRLRQGGYVPLFDGRSLGGWKGLVADPPARAKMTPEEMARAQAAADERMRAHWSVADGLLVFDGKGESLCTARDYGDFEMLVDWKIAKAGDSGIYLRGSPQVQIWDPDANPEGSGGLYNNQKGPRKPLEKADQLGRRVEHVPHRHDRRARHGLSQRPHGRRQHRPRELLGARQADLPARASSSSRPTATRSGSGTSGSGRSRATRRPRARALHMSDRTQKRTKVSFRSSTARTSPAGRATRRDTGPRTARIVVHPELGGGNLYTEKEYADFVLRFEFRLTPAANNGIGIRAPLEGDAAYAGMEIQVLEDGSPVYWDLQPYQYHGSVYGVVPARRGVLRPIGEWNTEEIVARGRRITVTVNGDARRRRRPRPGERRRHHRPPRASRPGAGARRTSASSATARSSSSGTSGSGS